MALSFAINYEGVFLDLEENSYLTVDWFSTLFNESEIFRGSYSYAVKLKLSEKNKGILKMPHLLENRTSRVRYEVSILLFGHTWKNALLEIEFVQDQLSGNLLIDNSIIADILRDTTLPDLFSYTTTTGKTYELLDIGETELEKQSYFNESVSGTFPVVFPPFRNYGWNGEFGLGSDKNINTYIVPFENYNLIPSSLLYCPMFFLNWVIRSVCDKIGFQAIGSFFEDAEVSKWIVFNNSYYTGREILTSGFNIVISRHLPNLSIGNFFKVLRNDLKLPIYFDSLRKTVRIELPKVFLENNDFVALDDNVVQKSLKIKGGQLKKYVVKRSSSEDDAVQQYFDSIDSVSIGTSETATPVELTISSPKMGQFYEDRFNNRSFRMPIADHMANVYDKELSGIGSYNKEGEFNKNELSFMLLSYRGLLPCVPGNQLLKTPFSTSDNKDAIGNSQPEWISTNPLVENGWVRKICEPLYQMLSISENVELDVLLPIHKFLDIDPLSKIRFKTKNGSISSLLLDKITFEPSNRNTLIYSKIKALSLNRSQLLFGVDLQFKTDTETKLPENTYVFAKFVFIRTEEGNPNGLDYYGYLLLEFYKDKYKVIPKAVSNLQIKLEIKRNIRNSTGESTLIFDKTYTTGSNVFDYVPDEEFIYEVTTVGGAFTSEIIIIEDENKKYIPGN